MINTSRLARVSSDVSTRTTPTSNNTFHLNTSSTAQAIASTLPTGASDESSGETSTFAYFTHSTLSPRDSLPVNMTNLSLTSTGELQTDNTPQATHIKGPLVQLCTTSEYFKDWHHVLQWSDLVVVYLIPASMLIYIYAALLVHTWRCRDVSLQKYRGRVAMTGCFIAVFYITQLPCQLVYMVVPIFSNITPTLLLGMRFAESLTFCQGLLNLLVYLVSSSELRAKKNCDAQHGQGRLNEFQICHRPQNIYNLQM